MGVILNPLDFKYRKTGGEENYRMKRATIAWLLLWGLFVCACAYMIPYFSNDYRYMLIQGGDGIVSSFGDLAVSQWNHYFQWGGRAVAHTIAQLLLWAGKPVSAVAAALCYVILMVVICAHATGRAPSLSTLRFPLVFFVTFLVWLCLRIYGEVVFMLVSSCNYLYTTTLVLIFLLPYRISIRRDPVEGGVLAAFGMFVLGVLAGWTNENTGAAAFGGVVLVCAWLLKSRQLRAWHVAGFVGLTAGYLLLMLSPGNAARLDSMEDGGYTFAKHFPVAVGIFFSTLLTQLPIIAVFAYLAFRAWKTGAAKECPHAWYGALWDGLVGLASLGVMIFSPNFPSRSTAPFTFLAVASAAGMLELLHSRGIEAVPALWRKVLYVAAALYLIPTAANTVHGYRQAQLDGRARDSEITAQLEAGARDLVVRPFHVKTSKYMFIGDVRARKSYFANNILRKFYKVRSIRRTCDYKMPWYPYDYIVLAKIGKPVCTGDRGDPEDPADPLNQRYLKDHPDEMSRLKFGNGEGGRTPQMFMEAMERLGFEDAGKYLPQVKEKDDD